MKRIKRIGVIQTAKVVAILYLVSSAIFTIPLGLVAMFTGQKNTSGGIFILFFPLIYFFIGFVITAIGCSIYNIIAQKFGGIELELTKNTDGR